MRGAADIEGRAQRRRQPVHRLCRVQSLVHQGLDAAQAVDRLAAALGAPFDVSGTAHVAGRTQVRIEGMAASVAYRRARLLDGVLAGFEPVEGAASAKLWQEVRDVTPFAGRDGAVWRVSVKPTDGPRLGAAVRGEAIYDWGGGLVWLLVPAGGDAGAAEVRGAVERLGGHATLVRAPDAVRAAVPVFQPEPAPLAAISAGLRAKFDPRGILNPGLMG